LCYFEQNMHPASRASFIAFFFELIGDGKRGLMIRAEPFLGTKHMYRKKRLCLQGAKYAVPRQIKPVIFRLTTSRGQSNLRTSFNFASCVEKGCYRIVSLGL